MGMNYYKVTEKSYINLALVEPGTVVRINDDPDNGGMRPGKNLVACDEDGNEIKRAAPKPAKPVTKAAAAAAADDLG